MKFVGRRTVTARSETADLFVKAYAKNEPVPVSASAAPPRQVTQRGTQQLWYAVVFPELPQSKALDTLRHLCLYALRFTSLVSIEMPNALLLEIRGSVKLFGSMENLHADIDAVWQNLRFAAHTAAAPTTLAALWLARAAKRVNIFDSGLLAGALAEVPISCTEWHPDHLQTMYSMGVTRMSELLRLPRAGLARRLAPQCVMDMDIALGRQAAPRRAFISRERFRQRTDFETEIETVVYLQKALEPMIELCSKFLRDRQAGVQSLELRLRHRVVPDTRVRVGLASITGERRRLTDVLVEKLHRLALRAPVRSMELVSGALLPLSADSLDAFAGLRGEGRDTAPQLVERLRARLGEKAVYGIVSIAEHRPEAAWARVRELRLDPDVPTSSSCVLKNECEGDMPRPIWLLAEPVMLSDTDLQELRQGDLILEEGPERIESGWWDGKGVARDYYIARQLHGARWWIFQERQTKDWFLHGVFA